MAYCVIAEIPGGTLEQYDAMAAAIARAEETSRGLIVHFAGMAADSLVVVDLWESEEAYRHHIDAIDERAGEAIQRIDLPPYSHRQFEVPRLVSDGSARSAKRAGENLPGQS